nr:unnamed protein product [Callosobruchus analis]
MHINICSLRTKLGQLEAEIMDQSVDVICLTEHWLTEMEVSITCISGYKLAAYSARKNFNGGFNLVQTIYEPTRGKNVIDNIFVDSGISLLSSRVEDTGLSDHGSQYVHLMLENRQSATVENKIMYRPVTQQGMNLFFNRVSAVEWNFINDNSMSVDGRFNKFINILEEAYLESFPEKQYKVGSDKGEKVGWFDEHLKNMRDHLKFLEELRKQYNQPDLVQVCSMFRKQYKLAIAKAKMTIKLKNLKIHLDACGIS